MTIEQSGLGSSSRAGCATLVQSRDREGAVDAELRAPLPDGGAFEKVAAHHDEVAANVSSAKATSLPPASILGVGAMTPVGRDLGEIARKLGEPAPAPRSTLRVDDALLSDAVVGRSMRRADRFIRMAALAAKDAWSVAESAHDGISKERVGLIIASGFGPHGRGFRFLDGLLDCGDLEALPTDFSHSVHGAAASYITEMLELRGPSLSITDFECGFEQAVLLAQCWLAQGTCDRVLVGAVEETGEVLIRCASRILGGDERFVPGEGAVFWVLAPAHVAGIARLEATSRPEGLELVMLDWPSIFPPGEKEANPHARRMTTFTPWFGHSPGSSAFQLLGGFLSLGAAQPLGQIILTASDAGGVSSPVDNAATRKPLCGSRSATLVLTKS